MSNSLIGSLTAQGKAEDAQLVLESMCQDFENCSQNRKPDQRSFNAVLNVLAQKGQDSDAEKLLKTMIKLQKSGKYPHLQPTAFSYNCCVHAGFRSSNRESGNRAMLLLEAFERYAT